MIEPISRAEISFGFNQREGSVRRRILMAEDRTGNGGEDGLGGCNIGRNIFSKDYS